MIDFKTYKRELLEDWQRIPKTQYGSNDGGLHMDEMGNKSYIKFPATPEQAHAEVASANLYHALGIRTVSPEVIKENGRVGVSSKWNPDLKSLKREDLEELSKNQKHADALALMHHAAIMTGNRDIVGLDYGNIMHDTKNDELVSVDQGGSFDHRAMGGKKDFNPDIKDVETFKTPRYTVHHVFSGVYEHHPEAFKRASEAISRLPDTKVSEILKTHSMGHHFDTVNTRRRLLAQHSV